MTTAPVASINDELLDEIQYRAEYCEREVIRSHPWRDMDLDVLAADERFIRSATPANVHAIITELRTLRAENAALAKDAGRYLSALQEITAIEYRYNCGDWDEIEEARNIAIAAIQS
jgi:hypothetical protein